MNFSFCRWYGGSKKDPLDFTDADVENLYKQWEENDDVKLPLDEQDELQRLRQGTKSMNQLPDMKFISRYENVLFALFLGKQRPMFNMNDLAGKNPEEIMKLSKKGQTLMMFVTISDNPTRQETEDITQIWYYGLKNALYDVSKYVVDDNRILLLLQDGSQAFEIKDFLVQQDRCEEVTIDNRPYYGKGSKKTRTQDL
ncbi:unnamed protein product [Didymodactylos carnosus]|uniref:Mesoderm development candidate 2 n=1 Tax=Didymodactylos carnosus TaxID=1234261 RepID=A0A813YQG8_9BILA|nr:unnamed protein product [Didymodactylos carnosus]CAF1111727.1 unnamed protein product [Didymodactylos carnosus]CAF3672488.1 unnamed protein product [Didymodactylos carnosus]CAF3879890.1 unnamed protein product [Didymodactylos carnosus]